MTKEEALAFDLALEALEKSVATCFDRCAHEQVMSRPEHFINKAITAIKQARSAQVQEPGRNHYEDGDVFERIAAMNKPPAQPAAPVQELGARVDAVVAKIKAGIAEKPTALNSYGLKMWGSVRDDLLAIAATPPAAKRQWVGLTDEEVMQTMSGDWTSQFYFARAIEAKLRSNNNG